MEQPIPSEVLRLKKNCIDDGNFTVGYALQVTVNECGNSQLC